MYATCGFFAFVLLLSFSQCTVVDIAPKQVDCYWEEIMKGTKVAIEFQVIEGGNLDLEMKVYGPDKDILYSVYGDRVGVYHFITHIKGTYQMCLGNPMSRITSKKVDFTFTIGDQRSEEEIVLSILAGRGKHDQKKLKS